MSVLRTWERTGRKATHSGVEAVRCLRAECSSDAENEEHEDETVHAGRARAAGGIVSILQGGKDGKDKTYLLLASPRQRMTARRTAVAKTSEKNALMLVM